MNTTTVTSNKTEFKLEAESPSIISDSCNKKTSSSSVGDLHQGFHQKGVFLYHQQQQQRVEMSTDTNNNIHIPQLHQGNPKSTTTATDKVP